MCKLYQQPFSQHGNISMTDDKRIKQIEKILTVCELRLAGPVIADYEDTNRFIIFVHASINDDGVRSPGRTQLKTVQSLLNTEGYDTSFVLVNDNKWNIDNTVKAYLFDKYDNNIRNSFSIENSDEIDILIEPKTYLDEKQYDTIEKELNSFLKAITKKSVNINFTKKNNLPSSGAILRTIRIKSPVNLKDISNSLTNKGYDCPNEVWLKHALDKIRKSGFISWRQPGYYYMTLIGLNSLGTEKSRISPDIARALELAFRGR